jgi:hypothetical protein
MHPTQKPAVDPTDVIDWSPADLLRAAAVYLQRYGWIRCDYFAPARVPFPAACATGAIRAAATGIPAMDQYATLVGGCDPSTRRSIYAAVWALADHLGLDTEPDILADDVADWNDDKARTADQVITALLTAADAYDIEAYGQAELDQDRNPTWNGYLQHRVSVAANPDRGHHTGGAA